MTLIHRKASSSVCESDRDPQALHENETPHDSDEDKSEDEILSGERFEMETGTKNMPKAMDMFTVVTTSNGRGLIPASVPFSAAGETRYPNMQYFDGWKSKTDVNDLAQTMDNARKLPQRHAQRRKSFEGTCFFFMISRFAVREPG